MREKETCGGRAFLGEGRAAGNARAALEKLPATSRDLTQSGPSRTGARRSLLRCVAFFARVLESYDARYVACYEATKRDLRLKLFCMDPSAHIAERLAHARSTIFFSATLTPMEYHRTTIGCGAGPGLGLGPKPKNDAQCYVLPSPFPKENLSILIAERIATTYRRRDATRESLARLLATFVSMKRGNYLLYFPSYQYMAAVQEALAAIAAEVELVVQHGAMEEHERSAFLDRFSESNERTLVGLAVMGGFFGEGIDLVGERLTGAAVIGVGLPGLSPERDHIKNHFERERGAGFDYAYMFPGMNRVLQAAGRVIRSETDRGAVLLVGRALCASALPGPSAARVGAHLRR